MCSLLIRSPRETVSSADCRGTQPCSSVRTSMGHAWDDDKGPSGTGKRHWYATLYLNSSIWRNAHIERIKGIARRCITIQHLLGIRQLQQARINARCHLSNLFTG